jgi:hypothetical protein
MPNGIAGDQSPPGERIWPTFRDILIFVETVVRVGTRACCISTEAPWLLELNLVEERARSRKRTNRPSGEIEIKDREIAACELLGVVADAVLSEYGEGSTAVGEAQTYHYAPLERRNTGAARIRGLESETSGKHWFQHYAPLMMHGMADLLYRLIEAPDTVDITAFGEGWAQPVSPM